MESIKKFLHDRVILALITVMAVLLVVGVSLVLLRFDASKNATTTIAYRQNSTSIGLGKPLDIYLLAVFMLFISASSVILGSRIYAVRRPVAVFALAGAVFLLVLSIIVANSLIAHQ